jgi:hypothetical protein
MHNHMFFAAIVAAALEGIAGTASFDFVWHQLLLACKDGNGSSLRCVSWNNCKKIREAQIFATARLIVINYTCQPEPQSHRTWADLAVRRLPSWPLPELALAHPGLPWTWPQAPATRHGDLAAPTCTLREPAILTCASIVAASKVISW